MSFFTREQRYEMLCAIKRGHAGGLPVNPMCQLMAALTPEEEAFIVEFATEKFNEVMKDPEVVAVMQRLKER